MLEVKHYNEKLCHFFTLYNSMSNLSNRWYYFRKLVSMLVSRKDFAIFRFLSVMAEKQKSTISESYRFMGVIYKSKKLFLAKVPLSNQFNFKRSLELWQMPLKVTGSIYRILKNQKTISYAKRSMIKQLAWLI